MTIRALFFGHYRDIVPSGEQVLTLPDSATVSEAAAALAATELRLRDILSRTRVAVGANFATPGGGDIGHPSHIFIGNDEGPGNRNKWFFALGGGYLNFHINGPTLGPQFFPLVPFSPTVGVWYHLAVVRRGSTYTIFLNGIPSGSATNANAIPNPNAPLTIGQAENLGFVNGVLELIRKKRNR